VAGGVQAAAARSVLPLRPWAQVAAAVDLDAQLLIGPVWKSSSTPATASWCAVRTSVRSTGVRGTAVTGMPWRLAREARVPDRMDAPADPVQAAAAARHRGVVQSRPVQFANRDQAVPAARDRRDRLIGGASRKLSRAELG
jgi:hypothetical protein